MGQSPGSLKPSESPYHTRIVRLALRHGLLEGIQRLAFLVNLVEQRIGRHVDVEDTRVIELRDQLEIGNGRFVVKRERGLRHTPLQHILQRAIPVMNPVIVPSRPIRIRLSVFILQMSLHTPHIDRRSEERRVGKECRSRWSADH